MCGECETFGEFQAGDVCPSGLIIMPAGDSTTVGQAIDSNYDYLGAWRVQLWECFNKANLSQSFVGSQSNGPAQLTDKSHEGHSGFYIADWTAGDYLAANPANVVIVLLGTNNAFSGGGHMASFQADYEAMLDYCRASPLTPSVLAVNLPESQSGALEANYLIGNGYIASAVAARAPWCHLVDMRDASAMWNPGFNPSSTLPADDFACFTTDLIHYNARGYQRIAEQVFRTARNLPNLGNE